MFTSFLQGSSQEEAAGSSLESQSDSKAAAGASSALTEDTGNVCSASSKTHHGFISMVSFKGK